MLRAKRIVSALKLIYKPEYLVLNSFLAFVYYFFLSYLVNLQNGSIFFVIPKYLTYSLVITSSILLTIAVYSIRNTRRNKAKFSASGLSIGSIAVGSGLCGCTTSFPVLLAGAIGFNAAGIISLQSFLVNYNIQLFALLVAINIGTLAYYLNRLSDPGCSMRKRK